MEQAMAAAGIYAALNTFIFMWLANATGKIRRAERIALGDGGNAALAKAMRGSANAAENVPMFTVCLVVAAAIGMPVWVVHLTGLVYFAGRVAHGLYFIRPKTPFSVRIVGFGVALLAHAVLAVGLLAHGLAQML